MLTGLEHLPANEKTENQRTGPGLFTESGSKSLNGGRGIKKVPLKQALILLMAAMKDNTILRMSKIRIRYLVNLFHVLLCK